MRNFSPKFAAALLVLSTGPLAYAQDDKPGVAVAEVAETVAVVRGVNQVERTVTLEGPDGNLVTLMVPPEAQNLDQVYAGAKFRIRYLEAVAVSVSGAGAQPDAGGATVMQLAPKGANPSGVVVRVKRIQARVDAINYDDRTVVLTGPLGNHVKLKVDERVQRLNEVQVGDMVAVSYTEALSMEMIKE
jgi:hypothetical protein